MLKGGGDPALSYAAAQFFSSGGTNFRLIRFESHHKRVTKGSKMNGIIYLVGLVVVILAVLSFFGLR